MDEAERSNPDLESFRAQWRAEVLARSSTSGGSRQAETGSTSTAPAPSSRAARKLAPGRNANIKDDDEDHVLAPSFDEPQPVDVPTTKDQPEAVHTGEPVSALEHYEKAVEREAVGNLGDSLRLYRRAFRVR